MLQEREVRSLYQVLARTKQLFLDSSEHFETENQK